MFITCACEHCDQHIEFSTDDFQETRRTPEAVFGQEVKCPGCGKDTTLLISQSPPVIPKSKWRKPSRRTLKIAGVYLAIAILLIFVCNLIIAKIGMERIANGVGFGAVSLVSIAIFTGLVLLAIFWILFPVLMYYQLKRSNSLLEMVEKNTRPTTKRELPVAGSQR